MSDLEVEVAIFSYDDAVYNPDTEQYDPGWVLQINNAAGRELTSKSCRQPGPLMKYALGWLEDRGFEMGHLTTTAHKTLIRKGFGDT